MLQSQVYSQCTTNIHHVSWKNGERRGRTVINLDHAITDWRVPEMPRPKTSWPKTGVHIPRFVIMQIIELQPFTEAIQRTDTYRLRESNVPPSCILAVALSINKESNTCTINALVHIQDSFKYLYSWAKNMSQSPLDLKPDAAPGGMVPLYHVY